MTVPVIVLGHATTALSCVRVLTRAGYRTYAACQDDAWPPLSRHYNPCPRSAIGRWRGELGLAGIQHLEAMAFENCVLLPAADDAADWLSRLPLTLRQRYHTSNSSTETLQRLQDKSAFAALLSDLNVPSPRTEFLKSREDVTAISFDDFDSVFLKPVDSQAYAKKFMKKGVWVNDVGSALKVWQEAHDAGLEMVAQEYVPGRSSDHYFIDGFRDRHGAVSAKMARRRWRIYPPDFGNSSYCESVAFAEVESAWPGLESLLRAVRYRGVFSAEFKRDCRDGILKVLEVNTRPWVYVEFAAMCGMDVCDAYARDALNDDVPKNEGYAVGKGCVDLYNDARNWMRVRGEVRPGAPTIILQWLNSFKVMFSWSDPAPASRFVWTLIRTKILRKE